MINLKKMNSFLVAGFLILGVSCSHIEMDRKPSSMSQSVGVCQLVADDSGRAWQVLVNDKPYPDDTKLAHFEAQKLMTRFSQTGTCNY
jgi:hypothetical protein